MADDRDRWHDRLRRWLKWGLWALVLAVIGCVTALSWLPPELLASPRGWLAVPGAAVLMVIVLFLFGTGRRW